jgi:hypothetical protein
MTPDQIGSIDHKKMVKMVKMVKWWPIKKMVKMVKMVKKPLDNPLLNSI